MFVELHMIQSFAPANLNRDDTGMPKECEFGGHRRARISSQCIKRSIRLHSSFSQTTQVPVAQRTKWIVRPLSRAMKGAGKEPEAAELVARRFAAAFTKLEKNQVRTAVLLYLGQDEIEEFSRGLIRVWGSVVQEDDKAAESAMKDLVKGVVKTTKGRTGAPDIALFGRMLADRPDLSIDAACQVAHAISTHRVNVEMDYYTAVDDLLQEEEAGAGMIGLTGYNSACFYRYACISWEQLLNNLGGDVGLARRSIEGFLRASVAAVPSGKQNAFAAQNPPSFLLAVARDDGMAWSLANAFERPVRPGIETGYLQPSVEALDAYWADLSHIYGGEPQVAALSLGMEATIPNLQSSLQSNLESWISAVMATLPAGE